MSEEGKLQNYSVDQVAGAFVLCMGAIASLLLVVWQSKCHCKCNLCYLFQCERRPPSEDEMTETLTRGDRRLRDRRSWALVSPRTTHATAHAGI